MLDPGHNGANYKHPEVIAARRRLEILRSKPPSQPPLQGTTGTSDTTREQAPLKISLGEAEADVAAYSDQVGRLQARLTKFEESAAQIPEAEADLAELTRDYDVIKIKHGELSAHARVTSM